MIAIEYDDLILGAMYEMGVSLYAGNIDTIECNASVATSNATLGTFPQDASKYGVLMQFAGTSYFAAQIYISANNYVFFRRRDDTVWGEWIHMDNFGCSTPAELASLLGVDGIPLSIITAADSPWAGENAFSFYLRYGSNDTITIAIKNTNSGGAFAYKINNGAWNIIQ